MVNLVQHSLRGDGISVPDHWVWVAALPPDPPPPSSGAHGNLLQEFKFVENPPDSQGHAGHRVLGDRHGKLGFRPDQPVQPTEEATTAGDDDARIDDIRSQFRGGLLETGAHGFDNGHHRVAQRLPNVVLSENDGLREAVDEIPALHVYGALLTVPRVGRTEVDLDLLGPTLANQKVIVLPNVLPDRLVHLVTRDPHRLAVDDARQRNHCHLGGPAADADEQIAAALLN